MKDSKALPIFSPKAISTVVNFIKKERPDLWESWKALEESSDKDLYTKTIDEIMALIRPLNMAKTLSDMTALMWSVRNIIRSELSLPLAETSFTKEQISTSVSRLKQSRPDLWETWKSYEKNGQNYQPIREGLVTVLQEMKITKNSVEMQSLITAIRQVVLVESGVWKPDEI